MSLPKMASHSFDPREALLTELSQKFPEVFTEGQIDFEKMQNFLREEFSDSKDRYRMTWAGRKAAIQQVQVKTTDTLVPDQEQSVNFDTTENVFIEGDNLEVLRVLQRSYYGKVKMIYIDPPYNTGNDFIYHDDFKQNKTEYRQKSGMADEEGNIVNESAFSKNRADQGHYHSDWLSMMFPRLYLSKNLLRQDGIIFISIDDNEAPRLRLLLDEIFGEENFRGEIAVKRGAKSVQMQFDTVDALTVAYEKVLMYTKLGSYRFPRPEKSRVDHNDGQWNNHWRGTDRPTMRYELLKVTPPSGQWRWSKERSLKAIKNYTQCLQDLNASSNFPPQQNIDSWWLEQTNSPDLLRLSKTGKPEHYVPPSNSTLLTNLWSDVPVSDTRIVNNLLGKSFFDNPKSIELLKTCLLFSDHDSLVLDFFAGSATTAHAVMQLNAEDGGDRKWICVQLDENCEKNGDAYTAGYKTIADIARERIRRAGKKIQEEKKVDHLDVGFKSFRLAKSNFPVWQGVVQDEHDLLAQMDLFANAQQHDAKPMDLLYELILKEGLDINIDIQQKESAAGIYYLINQGKLAISFASVITPKLMDLLFLEKPEKIILLESAFTSNDELKMNTVLHAQTLKIDIRVI